MDRNGCVQPDLHNPRSRKARAQWGPASFCAIPASAVPHGAGHLLRSRTQVTNRSDPFRSQSRGTRPDQTRPIATRCTRHDDLPTSRYSLVPPAPLCHCLFRLCLTSACHRPFISLSCSSLGRSLIATTVSRHCLPDATPSGQPAARPHQPSISPRPRTVTHCLNLVMRKARISSAGDMP